MVVTLLVAALQVALLVITFSDEASTLLAFLASHVVALLVTFLQLVFFFGILGGYLPGAFGILSGHLDGG